MVCSSVLFILFFPRSTVRSSHETFGLQNGTYRTKWMQRVCVCAHFFEFIFERFVTKIEFTTHNTNTCTHSGPVWFSSCVPNYRNLVCDSMPMPKRAQKRTSMYTVHTHTRVRHQWRDKSRFRCKSIIIFFSPLIDINCFHLNQSSY